MGLLGRIAALMQQLNTFVAMKPGFAYLQFLYHSPLTEKNEPFPEGTVIKVEYIDKAGRTTEHAGSLQIAGKSGKVSFQMERRYKLRFGLDFSARPYFNVTDNKLMTALEFQQARTGDSLYLTKKAVMLLPDRIDLKNCPWEIDSDLFNDADGQRCFEGLDKKELKGDSEYLPVVVKPEWMFVSFPFHDQVSGDEAQLPQGIWLEGINEGASEDIPVAASSFVKDKNLLLPWFLTRDQSKTRGKMETVLKFETSHLFVKGGKIIEKDPADVWKEPLTERLKYFDLPEHFVSDNWRVKLDTDWKYCHNLINEATAKDKPLTFFLDSAVLTDDSLETINWVGDKRFAAMDMKLGVISPDTDRPYWTDKASSANFIGPEHVDQPVRLVACDGKFYDVTHKRCIRGDAVGARAAVQADADVHVSEALVEPLVSAAGNLEVHFLRECLDAGNKEAAYLLIYWSAKVNADVGADASDLFKSGFTGSRERWELKDYTIEPRENPNGKGSKVIPVFYFEGRDTDPAKCAIALHPAGDARASMGLHSANFIEGNETPSGDSVDEDGVRYTWFTMAHELGHAVGLDDEYAEPVEDVWNPVLPAYVQYHPGMPYSSDLASMMNSNQAPRLRHFWHLCRWMNKTDGVKQLTGDTVFQVKSGRGPTYKYYWKVAAKDYLTPSYKQEGFTNGTFGKMDLFLYWLGEDESTAKLLPGQVGLNGILVVAPKLAFTFFMRGAAKWLTKDNRLNYMKQFQNHIAALNKRIYLECAANDDFKKIYVHFMPLYHYGASGDAHITFGIVKHRPTGSAYEAEFYGAGFTGNTAKVDENQNHISMFRYVLGLKPYREVPAPDGGEGNVKQAITTIDKGDLTFLAEWVKGKRGHDFTVKE